jgi:hypothetical protein
MQGASLWVLALYQPFRHLNGDIVGATNLNFHSENSCLYSVKLSHFVCTAETVSGFAQTYGE